jgi:nucleoside-diphosphate-sugar epimerase
MRVVVTGGLGFIGSHVAERYRDDGHHVVIIDNGSGAVVHDIPGTTVIRDDVRNIDLGHLRGDLIVHCASPVGAVGLLSLAGRIVTDIVGVTAHVTEAAARTDCPLVNISSSEVYGFSGTYSEADSCIVPAKHSARLEYAVGKLAAEHAVIGTPGLRSITIRPFNVAGPRQTRAKGFVLPTFVEQARAGRPLTVFGDGHQERSFTAVYDVVDFIANLRHGDFDGRVVNVGNPHNRTTVRDLADDVIGLVGADSEVIFTTGKAVHGDAYEEAEGIVKVPDTTRANLMGWQPRVDLDRLIMLTASDMEAVPC